MGKRFWSGICLFCLLPILGLFTCRYFYCTHIWLYENMDDAAWALAQEDTETAANILKTVKNTWNHNKKTASAFSSHNTPDRIRESFSRLDTQLAAGEYSHAAETCRELSVFFFSLATEQIPTWWKIF